MPELLLVIRQTLPVKRVAIAARNHKRSGAEAKVVSDTHWGFWLL
jgi:hypothetical protein